MGVVWKEIQSVGAGVNKNLGEDAIDSAQKVQMQHTKRLSSVSSTATPASTLPTVNDTNIAACRVSEQKIWRFACKLRELKDSQNPLATERAVDQGPAPSQLRSLCLGHVRTVRGQVNIRRSTRAVNRHCWLKYSS